MTTETTFCAACWTSVGPWHKCAPKPTPTLADVATAVGELPEMVGEPNEGGWSLVRRTAVLDILAGYAYATAAAELGVREPDPNRKGMPKCPRCGDIAYRPQPVTTRQERWRCGGCHRTLNYCLCTDISDEPAR